MRRFPVPYCSIFVINAEFYRHFLPQAWLIWSLFFNKFVNCRYTTLSKKRLKTHNACKTPCTLRILKNIEEKNFIFKSIFYPLDKERKLNLHKIFKKCPRRLLKILYTFNLHPVSRECVLLFLFPFLRFVCY